MTSLIREVYCKECVRYYRSNGGSVFDNGDLPEDINNISLPAMLPCSTIELEGMKAFAMRAIE